MKSINQTIRRKARERVREWADTFGAIGVRDLSLMSRFWEVPFIILFLATRRVRFSVQDIVHMLDGRYVGQEKLKQEVAYSFFLHLIRIQQFITDAKGTTDSGGEDDWTSVPEPESVLLPPSHLSMNGNLIIQGPTGSGKTSIVRFLCKMMGVPIIDIPCNTLVPVGIVGLTIPDAFMAAYNHYGEEAMQFSVVLLTELDKLKEKEEGEAIRCELLSLMDSQGQISFNTKPGDRGDNITLPTDHILFIADGVFSGMDEYYKPRMEFSVRHDELTVKEGGIRKEHFHRWGLSPELLARFSNFISIRPLSKDDILALLDCDASPLIPLRRQMETYGGSLVLTDAGKEALAERTVQSPFGIREMVTLLNRAFKSYIFSGNPLSGTLFLNEYSFD